MTYYKDHCKLYKGDTVVIPYELLPEPFQGSSKLKKGRKAVVMERSTRLLILQLIPNKQIVTCQYFDCDKLKVLSSSGQKPVYDSREFIDSLDNIKEKK